MLTEENATKRKKKEKSEIVVQAPRKRLEYRGQTKEPKISKVKWFLKKTRIFLYRDFYRLVLHYFVSVNRKVKSRLAIWQMECETFQHVELAIKVFKWIVLPASLIYVCADLYFFKENALDSMLLGILTYFYCNFLPDLPSIFRRKAYHDERDRLYELPWYKTYALLLFAPLFVGAFFLGMRVRWKTTETFHNFKSLAIYVAFLFVLGFLAFADFPIAIGDMTESLSIPLYALIGYLVHLKVDLCF